MNNDLVKRIAVCDMLHDEMGAWGNCADEIEALLKANDALWKIPAVDAVAVCRCKDCENWNTEEKSYFGTKCRCERFSLVGYSENYTLPNDFCSYGERKEDG